MQPLNTPLLEITDLVVRVEGKTVLNGISLTLKAGEVHAIMGRNGSGKTTLSHTLMGHPKYEVISGSIKLKGEDIKGLSPDERARRRLFLGFQYPVAIPGVTVANFLRSSLRAVRKDEVPPSEFRKLIRKEITTLGIPETFMTRFLNDGFSGGEKKRLETLQMRLLQPSVAVLDETDSGLDIDALRTVADSVNSLRAEDRAILLITHYQRMLDYVQPDHIHVLLDGRIVKSAGPELAKTLEEKGYDWLDNLKTTPAAVRG